MTAFEVLYDLALEIQIDPRHAKLTAHHHGDRTAVEANLRRVILQTVMPDEAINSHWQKLRIFCRNYVNRAQPAVTAAQMQDLLRVVEQTHEREDDRVAALAQTAAQVLTGPRVGELTAALQQVSSPRSVEALNGLSYLEWIEARWIHWANARADDLDAAELLRDVHVLSQNKATKIGGLGLPLAANFFADMGLPAFAKPDLHVTPIVSLLVLRTGESEAFAGLIRIAKAEHALLRRQQRFAWLEDAGGLWPRFFDRLIYLIGSDNFELSGRKNKRCAPQRRDLMRDALIAAGLIHGRYQ